MKVEINTKEEWQEFINLLEFTKRYISALTFKADKDITVKQLDDAGVCYIEWHFNPSTIEANGEKFTVNLPIFIKFVKHLGYPLTMTLGKGKIILYNDKSQATLTLLETDNFHKDTPEIKTTAEMSIGAGLFIDTMKFCSEISDEVRITIDTDTFTVEAMSDDLTQSYKESFVCTCEGKARAIFSLDYLAKLKLSGMLTVKLGNDQPIVIRNEKTTFIVAPRIYGEGDDVYSQSEEQ